MNSNVKFFISAVSALAVVLILGAGQQAVHAGAPPQQAAAASQNVLTYHGDNLRTGWFSDETQLTPANVNSQSFGLLQTVTLDERVDAEPLYVAQQMIQGQGTHNVIYTATENNSVYAIDAESGAILWQQNFGTAVPYQYKQGCDNVFPFMGILSTPVIDLTAGAMYFVADVYNGSTDTFYLHAISLASGADMVNPVAIQFSEPIQGGGTWTFNPQYQLQRPALLESNGQIYIGFGSACDTVANESRGIILRYSSTTLQQVKGQLLNRLILSSSFYLSSLWQSGYGPATDATGDVYFSTGNSDPYQASYSPQGNRPDSMLRLNAGLTKLIGSFTTYNYFGLDQGDTDIGSGGMMLLPDQSGTLPHLAVAGGKDGRSFLLNRDNMGGYTSGGPDNVVQIIIEGSCWCGPANYTDSSNVTHVLTGGGNGVTSWKLKTSPSTQLVEESTTGSGPVNGLADDGGVIPVVSSNGTTANTAVVWFVQRPATSSDQDPGTPVTLWAFAASNLATPLFSAHAGTWKHADNSNADLVPTVANGNVYVTSNKQLQIFGLLSNQDGASRAAMHRPPTPSAADVVGCPPSNGVVAAQHDLYGTVCHVAGTKLSLALPDGRSVVVDISDVLPHLRPTVLTLGRPVHVVTSVDAGGALRASRVSPSHLVPPLTAPVQ
jgi:hypothetical protein